MGEVVRCKKEGVLLTLVLLLFLQRVALLFLLILQLVVPLPTFLLTLLTLLTVAFLLTLSFALSFLQSQGLVVVVQVTH